MSDHLDTLVRNFVQGTPHMQDIGLVVTRLEKNRGSMSMPPRPQWMGDPARNLMHPGAITVLADSCCGLAVGAALDTHVTYATLDLRIDYLRPASPSLETHCDAHCYRLTRSVAFVRAEVWQEDRDEPVAAVQAAFMLSTPSGPRPVPGAGASHAQAAQPPDAAAAGTAAGGRDQAGPSDWRAPAASEPAMPPGAIPYLDYLGIRVAPDPVAPVFRLPFHPKLVGNPTLPALHGGVVAGFAETAAILHLNQTLRGEKLPKGIDFALDYLRGGRPEETFAACDVVRRGNRVALVQVRLWQRRPDVPIAVARAHCLLAPAD
jgi:uncharacterized protein (TIGR00369 family)